MSSNKLFVVAIDFGTTYSGYGFSNISNRHQIYTYSWLQGISQSLKTPTSILFTPRRDFHSFGYEAEEQYAALSQQKKNKDWYFFKRFKLTLYKNPVGFCYINRIMVIFICNKISICYFKDETSLFA